jgi:hypothetical protein
MKRSLWMLLLIAMSAVATSLASIAPQVAQATQNVLILTDNSPGDGVNGASHVSELIAAFASVPGATIATNSTELTNKSPMPLSLVSGRDVVIVVTVSGPTIDFADALTLEAAINSHASGAFMFFTDGCNGCARDSANLVLSIVNAVGCWSATLGYADNSNYHGSLTGAYSSAFTSLPTILGTAYSPLLGVPAADVIYTTNAPYSPGTMAAVCPGTVDSVCVYMATDVTPFWVTGGITPAQANGLAAAYLNAATSCPLLHGPVDFLGVTKVGAGSVVKSPNQSSYTPGAVVQLRASAGPNSEFVGWSGDASGSANPLTVTMTTDKDVTATFMRTRQCRDCPTAINYPNPFNPTTTIRYQIVEPARVSLAIYNLRGERVATLVTTPLHPAGWFEQQWNGTDYRGNPVASGAYFYRLAVGNETVTKKMLLLK